MNAIILFVFPPRKTQNSEDLVQKATHSAIDSATQHTKASDTHTQIRQESKTRAGAQCQREARALPGRAEHSGSTAYTGTDTLAFDRGTPLPFSLSLWSGAAPRY